MLETEGDIIQCIQEDEWMMNILKTVQTLELPDWWICAGFVRSKIWDVLHDFSVRTPLPDIDVIFFDSVHASERIEKEYEKHLVSISPHIPWSVKNQARMHSLNDMPPYSSSIDGVAKFPETVTALAVTLNKCEHVMLAAPWGVRDVLKMEVRPTKYYSRIRKAVYNRRIAAKKWSETWPKLKVFDADGKLRHTNRK
ncbi:nucleotidyltransferase family protein [Lederbergia sp. NSJ-179]|uniref:nucleotidyltransferase family protein n=1 Tax=Lederbergia sp. NSJ-179 TaxID=2931402 RepID=UPI001FD34D1B|nr:nucleotidyltransferase family protein [Lederbergia sp. NSJ-179]MCJ7840030.1 nucleotidyltransferase family protein [Lederbergia sp. NSJ-179]